MIGGHSQLRHLKQLLISKPLVFISKRLCWVMVSSSRCNYSLKWLSKSLLFLPSNVQHRGEKGLLPVLFIQKRKVWYFQFSEGRGPFCTNAYKLPTTRPGAISHRAWGRSQKPVLEDSTGACTEPCAQACPPIATGVSGFRSLLYFFFICILASVTPRMLTGGLC